MSLQLFVNTLSANWQFRDRVEAEAALRSLVECFSLVQSGLAAGTIHLIFDENIERRALIHGSASIASCIGSLDRDLRLRWYRFTRQARRVDVTFSEYSLEGGGEEIVGSASVEMIQTRLLAGFGGSPACMAQSVNLRDVDNNELRSCLSVHEPDGLRRVLPRYERNPKHRATEYWSSGELVAPMTVGDEDAQEALFASIDDGMGHYFGAHGAKLLKFVLTGNQNGPVFHAYEVRDSEVPPEILEKLRNQ